MSVRIVSSEANGFAADCPDPLNALPKNSSGDLEFSVTS